MSDRLVERRQFAPHNPGRGHAGISVAAMIKMIKDNDASGLEQALHQHSPDQSELHDILFRACSKQRDGIVEMLIRHPRYTKKILAAIVVDALACMQAEFAFDLLNRPSFQGRALNAALHEAAGRHEEEDRYSIVKELVKLGADACSRDEQGRTALEIAHSAGTPPAKLIGLLSTKKMQAAPPSSTSPQQNALPPELGERTVNSNLLPDTRTTGSATSDRQITHPQLGPKRDTAQLLDQAAKLGKQALRSRLERFKELSTLLHANDAGIAASDRTEICITLIRQIEKLDAGEDRKTAFMKMLAVCTLIPDADKGRMVKELARTLPHLLRKDVEAVTAALSDVAHKFFDAEELGALLFQCRAIAVCVSPNSMDLEPEAEALAKDYQALPKPMRLGIVLEVIRAVVANEDEIAQFKMLEPLMEMVEGLGEADRPAALLSLCEDLRALKGTQPWPRIFKRIAALAKPLSPADKPAIYAKLCGNFGTLPAVGNLELFDTVLLLSRELEAKNGAALLLFLAQNIAVLAEKGSGFLEQGFHALIGACADLEPDRAAPILVVLCCRLEELKVDRRMGIYMLLVSQLKILTPKAQRKLLTGWGLIHKLSYLPEKDRVAAYKALAAWALQLPEDERKAAVQALTDRDEALRHLPRTTEIREVREKLEQSVKKDS